MLQSEMAIEYINPALIAGSGITASCMLEWYADQDIQSVFSKCCFLRLAITVSSHFHSSFLASLTAGKLEGRTGLLIMGTFEFFGFDSRVAH